MSKTLEIGRRIELYSMDRHCHNVSFGLYERVVDGERRYCLHTYGQKDGVDERKAFLERCLTTMIGLEPVADDPQWLRFPCGSTHERALKRAFLDICKLESSSTPGALPLTAFDKKADCELTVQSLGDGQYEIVPAESDGQRRAGAVARGFAKLCEIDQSDDDPTRVAFGCGTAHDALMGQLLFRAQNVRAAMREEEDASGRGVLSAPGNQDE